MSNTVRRKIVATGLAEGLALTSVVVTQVAAYAGSATCNATYTTSTSVHTISNGSCYRVQARAQRYCSSGANHTEYGAITSGDSTVYASPGVFLSNRQGAGRPVLGQGWSPWKTFQNGSGSTSFQVNW